MEYTEWAIYYKEKWSIINTEENARLILGTLVGGIISLMVFSFSMVMVVINNASQSLSPRVVPGIIAHKPHQLVLGTYIGTILFCLIMVTAVGEAVPKGRSTADLGVMLSLVLGISCFGLFVYFIHSISQSIQVDAITNRVYERALGKIQQAIEQNKELPEKVFDKEKNGEDWKEVYTDTVGYLKNIHLSPLLSWLQERELKLEVVSRMGDFTVKGFPYLRVNQKLEKEEVNELQTFFEFYQQEYEHDHYRFDFKQITEIALKALSPGINDPRTAVRAVDLLTILFAEHFEIKDCTVYLNEEEKPLIFVREPTFEELLYECVTPIRQYGKEDHLVTGTVLDMLKNLIIVAVDQGHESNLSVLSKFVSSVSEEVDRSIHNSLDRKKLNRMLETIERLLNEREGIDPEDYIKLCIDE
ncbi:DUF2254 domain-containing protein [Algivirga pacifica]|uniref:DUF2254 domain-containing protein n=1 Tax=Algivirga pacifica TaxID=1162670 RepID=A0ABP9D0H7_9BACT